MWNVGIEGEKEEGKGGGKVRWKYVMLCKWLTIKLPKILDHWGDTKLSPQIELYGRITIKRNKCQFTKFIK